MIARCTNPNEPCYKDYGARGIRVCDEWMTFARFRADMGDKPDGSLTIERIDNNGNYCPSNCRWASRAEQNRNKRSNHNVTINGVTKTVTEWARSFGVSNHTIARRFGKKEGVA
jgi:hypothetical protein